MIILNIRATDNIQDYLDIVEQNGGGILNLAVATYNLADDLTIPTLTTLNGNGATLDFGGTAHGGRCGGHAVAGLHRRRPLDGDCVVGGDGRGRHGGDGCHGPSGLYRALA